LPFGSFRGCRQLPCGASDLAPGDRVELNLPMGLHVEAMPDDPSLRAFLCGRRFGFPSRYGQAPGFLGGRISGARSKKIAAAGDFSPAGWPRRCASLEPRFQECPGLRGASGPKAHLRSVPFDRPRGTILDLLESCMKRMFGTVSGRRRWRLALRFRFSVLSSLVRRGAPCVLNLC